MKILSPWSFLLLLPVLFSQGNLQAGASNKNGSPFSTTGSFYSNTGTFTAILRGSLNFLGAVTFTTSPSASSGTNTNSAIPNPTNSGVATIYAAGEQFQGSAWGTVSGSSIAATYIGNYSYQDTAYLSFTYTNVLVSNVNVSTPVTNYVITNVATPVVTYSTNSTVVYTNVVTVTTNKFTNQISVYTNGAVQNLPYITNIITSVTNSVPVATNISFVPQTNITYTVVTNQVASYTQFPTLISFTNVITTNSYQTNRFTNTCSGQFTASLAQSYPVQTFSGNGTAAVIIYSYGEKGVTNNTVSFDNSVSGTRISQ